MDLIFNTLNIDFLEFRFKTVRCDGYVHGSEFNSIPDLIYNFFKFLA